MHDRKMALMVNGPPDDDQVARNVQPTLGSEANVVQRRRLASMSSTYSAASVVSLDHELPHVAGHQAQPLQLRLRTHPHILERFDMICDHCKQEVTQDINGYWVGRDDTSECDADPGGHTVDGAIRG